SRLLHDIAIRRLFSTVKIYFMHGEPGFFMLNTENERYVRETSDFLLNRSFDILSYITANPSFANAVKTMSVHAFTDGPAVFEHRALGQALKSLPNLRSSTILPTIPFIYVREQKLDRIFAEWEHGSGDPRDLVSVIETNPIHELAILSTHVVLLPIRLDICPRVFADLPKEPGVLPRLTSFRLSCEFWDPDTTEMHVPLLSEFLSRRPSLCRLYIRIPAVRLEVALAIATVIGKLECLRVLGFHAGYEPLHEAAAFHLADQLSTKLEALQLVLPWTHDLHVRTWYPLVRILYLN
ncbi:hypothetical protein K438DRAFT_1868535, partial [Mycena galopus ATCC 62051]